MLGMSEPFQLQQQIPQYIGYEGLARALGVSTSTIRRKVRRKELPDPKDVSPNRRGWRIDELALRYPDKFGQLVANGVSDPNDLPPDELENQARDLAARAHSKRTGEAVDRRDIGLHYSPPVSVEDFMGAQLADHKVQVEYLARDCRRRRQSTPVLFVASDCAFFSARFRSSALRAR